MPFTWLVNTDWHTTWNTILTSCHQTESCLADVLLAFSLPLTDYSLKPSFDSHYLFSCVCVCVLCTSICQDLGDDL